MRRRLIAGNWKMNLTRSEAQALAQAVAAGANGSNLAELAICPPHVYLDVVSEAVGESSVMLGAQNMYWESAGAFTGEASPRMLAEFGCEMVILGHSERRALFGETDDDVRRKVVAAMAQNLTPIICVGETLEHREAGRTQEVIREQFAGGLAGHNPEKMASAVIAYEPVWAIGTGRVATPEQAEQVHADLRELLRNEYNEATAECIRILYGGSVKPTNAADLLSQPNIDGALVGGASLAADSFLSIASVA